MAQKKTSTAPPSQALGKRELQGFRQRLQVELASLTSQRAELEANAGDGGAERGAEDYADSSSWTFERESALSLADNLRDLTGKVEAALARIDEGSYGRCESCGEPVEAERLDALPYATACVACARRRARGR